MKLYVVVSCITLRTGSKLDVPLGAFESREKAATVAKERNHSLGVLLDHELHARGGNGTTASGVILRDVLAELGIAELHTIAVEMPVESESLIAIPRFTPRMA